MRRAGAGLSGAEMAALLAVSLVLALLLEAALSRVHLPSTVRLVVATGVAVNLSWLLVRRRPGR